MIYLLPWQEFGLKDGAFVRINFENMNKNFVEMKFVIYKEGDLWVLPNYWAQLLLYTGGERTFTSADEAKKYFDDFLRMMGCYLIDTEEEADRFKNKLAVLL
jgi:hypothetical protein